jgi:hypothetical protein
MTQQDVLEKMGSVASLYLITPTPLIESTTSKSCVLVAIHENAPPSTLTLALFHARWQIEHPDSDISLMEKEFDSFVQRAVDSGWDFVGDVRSRIYALKNRYKLKK